jgi:hypothetical protein
VSLAETHGEVLETLRDLLQSGALPAGAQDAGGRVLAEIAAKTPILIAGPESAGRDALANALCAQAIPETELFVADTPAAFDPASADVCIWCTAAFSASEAQVWKMVPNRLKQMSFLVPVANQMTVPERLNEAQLSYLQAIATEEFYGLFPIVLGAQPGMHYAEFSTTLLGEIATVVSWQRTAATDKACAFVDTYCGNPTPPKSDDVDVAATSQLPQNAVIRNAAQHALSVLAGYAGDLAPEMAGDDPETLVRILTTCSTAADKLAETMHPHLNAGGASRELALLSEDARTAADNILLLSIEGGLEPAIFAVTTLLQLRRELEVLNAA